MRAASFIGAGLLLLLFLAWVGMPYLLKWQLQVQGSQRLGRAVTVDQVDFAPWRLQTTLHRLTVARIDGKGPQLQVERVRFRTALSSLWIGAPVIDALEIEAPQLSLAHLGAGRFDVDDVLQHLAQPADPARPPVRFALRHFRLDRGSLSVDDRGRAHAVRDITLELPSLSSLGSERDLPATPRLAFTLDGSRFDTSAQATPFADVRSGEARLRFEGLDLAPYLSYLPPGLPVRLASGVLDADLQVSFVDGSTSDGRTLDIRGTVTAHRLQLAGAGGARLLAAEKLSIDIAHLKPFQRQVALSRLALTAPELRLHRAADGRLHEWMAGAPAGGVASTPTPAPAATARPAGTAQGASGSAASAAPAWTVAVAHASIRAGAIDWNDALPTGTAQLGLHEVQADLRDIAWPTAAPARIEGSARLTAPAPGGALRTGLGGGTGGPAVLTWKGTVAADRGQLDVTAAALPVAWAGPYLKGRLGPAVVGHLGADAAVGWSPVGVVAEIRTLGIDGLAVVQGSSDVLLGTGRLQLTDARIDTARRSAAVGRLAVRDPRGSLSRAANGRWMVEDWLDGVVSGAGATAATQPGGAGEWRDSGPMAGASTDGKTPKPQRNTGGTAGSNGNGNRAAINSSGTGDSRAGRKSTDGASGRSDGDDDSDDGGNPAGENTAAALSVPKASRAGLRSTNAPTAVNAAAAAASAAAASPPAQALSTATAAPSNTNPNPNPTSTSTSTTDASANSGSSSGSRSTLGPAPAPSSAAPTSIPTATPTPTPSRPAPTATPPWSVAVARVDVDGGAIAYRDASRARPVAVDLSAFRLTVADLAWPAAPARLSPLELSVRIAAGQAAPGSVRYRGSVGLAPFSLQGKLVATRVPLHAFEPYFGDVLNVQVSRADLGYDGDLRFVAAPAGPTIQVDANLLLEDGRIDSAAPDAPASAPAATNPPAGAASANARRRGALTAGSGRASSLLTWKTLGLRGLSVAVAPGTATRVTVQDTAIGDFFARIAIDGNGRINLQDLVRRTPSAPSTGATESIAGGAGGAGARGIKASDVSSAAPGPVLTFGPTRLVNGRVQFSDNFVKPSYTASLSELTGRLGAFASVPRADAQGPQMADLELRGKAEGTASLEIVGQLNPLAKPLALDIAGKVRDLDLPALSPYSIKYVGHGIERGKLSVDVSYKVQPDGQLTARNSLVLRQLVFGDPVDGAPSSLPVRLATALLTDRNGVIDLDLPISGSLNDPEFSLGPVIGRALTNLLARAVTAPFSLLANAFGGGGGTQEAATVAFAPGSTVLSADARSQLDRVAQALVDRPALQLTVTGAASLEAEREGYRRERLQQLARFEKRRVVLAALPPADANQPARSESVPVADVVVTADEYPVLLRQIYARTDMPKPRNLVGLAKDLPLAEMEALLMAQIDVDEDTAQTLAVRRGGAVRDYLAGKGVSTERLFLGAARREKSVPGWQPHAALNLAAR